MLKQILQGMVVGIANIIPGVSGGTMMVAMGLYDHLIHAITHLKSEFKKSMKLLIPIFLGAGIAIVVLSRLFEYLLEVYPIPTNFAFCGLIAGSLPFIFKKVKGHSVTVGKIIPFLIFFGIVITMALLGETNGAAADVSFGVVNVIKLFLVGVVAAATMVVPGVSGSMMLMLLGYYDTILKTINQFIDALIAFDVQKILAQWNSDSVWNRRCDRNLSDCKADRVYLYESGNPCILCDHRSDSGISDRNFVKSRLERTLCIDDSSRNRDILSRMVYSK